MGLKIFKTYKRERWVQIVLALAVVVWGLVLIMRHLRASEVTEVSEEEVVEPPVVVRVDAPKDTATEAPMTPKSKKAKKAAKPKYQRDHLNEEIE